MAPVPGGDGCLRGKVFGLTGELSRKSLEAAIKSNGATVSAIIHKRVSFVLCTSDAVKYNTQKVRKALKHGIPLVSQEFIEACVLASRVVDSTPFLEAPKPSSQASPANAAAKRSNSDVLVTSSGDDAAKSVKTTKQGAKNSQQGKEEAVLGFVDEACSVGVVCEEGRKTPRKKGKKRCRADAVGVGGGGGGDGCGEGCDADASIAVVAGGGGGGVEDGGGEAGGEENKRRRKKERKEKKDRQEKKEEEENNGKKKEKKRKKGKTEGKECKEEKGDKEKEEDKAKKEQKKEKKDKKKKRRNSAKPKSGNE